ncbi:MAG: RNA methyltransferase [Candidatus Cloacimonetes bacterium]|nr:RNA methyltransferase [Candidatus Cloacimonadota bacterium]
MNYNLDLCVLDISGDINLGSIMRLMENFKLRNLYLVKPKCKFSQSVSDFACHGKDRIESIIKKESLREIVASSYHYVIGTTANTGKNRNAVSSANLESISHVFSSDQDILLVMGRESSGMNNEELSMCDFTVNIPVNTDYPVLNLSHAVSIVLYEIEKLRGLKTPHMKNAKKATGVEIEALLNNMKDFLEDINYFQKSARHKHLSVLEEMVRRKELSSDEIRFLQGFLHVNDLYKKGLNH